MPHPRVQKHEADDADIMFAVPNIQLGASGNERRKNFRRDFIVQHRQVFPLGSEKYFVAVHWLVLRKELFLRQHLFEQ